MKALSEASPGAAYTVKWNVNSREGVAETRRFGLIPGANFYLLDSCFDGVVIRIQGRKVALGKDVAARIKV